MATDNGETIKSLHSAVGRSLRYVKRVQTEVKAVVDNNIRDPGRLRADEINEFRDLVEVFRGQLSEFKDLQSQFDRLAVNVEDQTYQAEMEEWADVAFDCKGLLVKCDRLVREALAVTAPVSSNAGSASTTQADQGLHDNFSRLITLLETQQAAQTPNSQTAMVSTQGHEPAIQAKLPQLQLPRFSGDMLKWKPFWDRFEASVDQNSKLAAVDKLSYLINQLEKVPLTMIEALPITNENYAVAVDMLKKKYGNPRMVVSLLYRKLNEMRPVKNDVVSLRTFVADINCLLGSLGALGQDTTDDNFTTIILSKLPNPVVVQLELSKEVEDVWTVAKLRSKLSDYLTRIERASNVSAANGKSQDERSGFSADSLLGGESKKKKGRGKKKPAEQETGGRKGPVCV
ncbi:MAG: DUF1759 domain-containing protein, partial [Pirellulales bacterium]